MVPKRRGDDDPRFPAFGSWIAVLRKTADLDQDGLADAAKISTDQVGRLERGENIGLWYVAAVMSVLYPVTKHLPDAALSSALAMDGTRIIEAGVLKDRLKSKAPSGEQPVPTATQRRRKTG